MVFLPLLFVMMNIGLSICGRWQIDVEGKVTINSFPAKLCNSTEQTCVPTKFRVNVAHLSKMYTSTVQANKWKLISGFSYETTFKGTPLFFTNKSQQLVKNLTKIIISPICPTKCGLTKAVAMSEFLLVSSSNWTKSEKFQWLSLRQISKLNQRVNVTISLTFKLINGGGVKDPSKLIATNNPRTVTLKLRASEPTPPVTETYSAEDENNSTSVSPLVSNTNQMKDEIDGDQKQTPPVKMSMSSTTVSSECVVERNSCQNGCGCNLTATALTNCNLNNCDGQCREIRDCPVPQVLQPGRAEWDKTVLPTSCKNGRCRILIPPRIDFKTVDQCRSCQNRCFLHNKGTLFECL